MIGAAFGSIELLSIAILAAPGPGPVPLAASLVTDLTPEEAKAGQAIAAKMKASPRGPFQGVAWYCKDGTTQLPRPNACSERGGGVQHGVHSADARQLAQLGVFTATILAITTTEELLANDLYRARALLVERFLERADDGWVMRAAKGYRGARQVEEEELATHKLLVDLCAQEPFASKRALALRLVRALPYEADSSLSDLIRSEAGIIGDGDKKFEPIRYKIHAMPEASDAELVDAYARTLKGEPQARAKALAVAIRKRFDPAAQRAELDNSRRRLADTKTRVALKKFLKLDPHKQTLGSIRAGVEALHAADLAYNRPATAKRGDRRLILLHAMGLIEEMWLGTAADLSRIAITRADALDLLAALIPAGGPLGIFSPREIDAAHQMIERARTGSTAEYASAVNDLLRTREWARARIVSDVWVALRRYQAVDAKAHLYSDDQLRSGMMLPLVTLLDRLAADVERLRPGGHRLVGIDRAGAVFGRNPGFAIGKLVALGASDDPSSVKKTDIVLLDELHPNLPPVAGIVSVGLESMLSHVALLAQNLGIPLIAIDGGARAEVSGWIGRQVLLGVSSTRRVVLGPVDGLSDEERSLAGASGSASSAPKPQLRLRIDRAALDLETARVLALSEVSEKDSGKKIGPKAAELSRLHRLFPDRVTDAAVIPFGVFLRHVSRPEADGLSPYDRLKAAYTAARSMPEEAAEAHVLSALERFRADIAAVAFPPGFEDEVKVALSRLGEPGTFGVFVRSDTNVEDLAEFTGAGLNLTVPNRVKVEAILGAIREVWASPFSQRSYQWRQRLLENPELVFPSVLLHKTVPSEISGVLVTTDVDRGGGPGITVSASEGVAAVVEGGAAETIVLEDGGKIRLVRSSRVAIKKAIPAPPEEGVRYLSAAGIDPLLGEKEIAEVRRLIGELQTKVPAPNEGAWDVEFGFSGGTLYLMQLRPLKRARAAGAHPLLRKLDEAAVLPDAPVDLTQGLP